MLRGLIAPILTPFTDHFTIDQPLYNQLAHQLLGRGCVGLAPFGTTGEALSVGLSERMQALEGLVADGIDPAVLVPGTGLTNLSDTVRLSRHALELGCGGVMVLPPFYYKGVAEPGLYDYFAALVAALDGLQPKIWLYHIPQVAGVGLPVGLVARLRADFPEAIVAIKDSSGDWANTEALLGIDGLAVWPGAELPVIEAIRLGAPGCISATANLNSVEIADVIRLCHAGDWQAAEARHKPVKDVRLLFQDYAPIPAQKALLARMTGEANWNNLRPPFQPLEEQAIARLASQLTTDYGFAI